MQAEQDEKLTPVIQSAVGSILLVQSVLQEEDELKEFECRQNLKALHLALSDFGKIKHFQIKQGLSNKLQRTIRPGIIKMRETNLRTKLFYSHPELESEFNKIDILLSVKHKSSQDIFIALKFLHTHLNNRFRAQTQGFQELSSDRTLGFNSRAKTVSMQEKLYKLYGIVEPNNQSLLQLFKYKDRNRLQSILRSKNSVLTRRLQRESCRQQSLRRQARKQQAKTNQLLPREHPRKVRNSILINKNKLKLKPQLSPIKLNPQLRPTPKITFLRNRQARRVSYDLLSQKNEDQDKLSAKSKNNTSFQDVLNSTLRVFRESQTVPVRKMQSCEMRRRESRGRKFLYEIGVNYYNF